ncbi:MAG: hypothetical protein ACJAS1_005010 [Oleiphilaceae bacterium]|jgi:hypothetical protein
MFYQARNLLLSLTCMLLLSACVGGGGTPSTAESFPRFAYVANGSDDNVSITALPSILAH